jgi:hypothetical protein
MIDTFECTHFIFVNGTMCKFCGRLQCDLCMKKHVSEHIANDDPKLQPEDME